MSQDRRELSKLIDRAKSIMTVRDVLTDDTRTIPPVKRMKFEAAFYSGLVEIVEELAQLRTDKKAER